MEDERKDEFSQQPVPGQAPEQQANSGSPKPEPQMPQVPAGAHAAQQGAQQQASQQAQTPGQTAQPQQSADLAPAPQVIESASATTSPDNRSGAAPYLIVVAVLALALISSLAFTGLLASVASDIEDEIRDQGLELNYGGQNQLGGNSDGYLDNGLGAGNGYANGYGSSNADLTADNVLDFDYRCFDESVNDYVFASDYAGSQAPVADFVRQLAKIEGDATTAAQSHLRAAASATDDATRASELQQLAQLCSDTQASVRGLALPAATGTRAEDIHGELEEAREDTAERWEDMAKIVAIMQSPSGHKASELDDLDSEASDVTSIAIDLSNALGDSAASR